jgi:hypothetical protein
MKRDITADEARALLKYDPDTGSFFWRVTRNNRTKAGSQAGNVEANGYTVIKIDGRIYKAHRLAWLITYGRWPDGEVDHINRIRADDRICNLRDVTTSENCRNRGTRSDNSSGYPGVHRRGAKWQARIHTDNGRISLGHFERLCDAVAARQSMERKLGYLTRPSGGMNAHAST